jgi:hypothetical protein
VSLYRKISFALLALLTFPLAAWLFVSWNIYGMAGFDCADRAGDVEVCVQVLHRQILLQAGAALVVWALAAWLTFRNWGQK